MNASISMHYTPHDCRVGRKRGHEEVKTWKIPTLVESAGTLQEQNTYPSAWTSVSGATRPDSRLLLR
jgi:hypothetical protein